MKRSLGVQLPDHRHLWPTTLWCSEAPSRATSGARRSFYADQFLAVESSNLCCSFSQVERKHEVELGVRIAHTAGKIDFQLTSVRLLGEHFQLHNIYSRFPTSDRLSDSAFEEPHRDAAHG